MTETERALEALATYLSKREGTRGTESYRWLVENIIKNGGSRAYVMQHGQAQCVVCEDEQTVFVCALEGEEAYVMLSELSLKTAGKTLRAVALPGDRLLKNALESAGMPAQVLLH